MELDRGSPQGRMPFYRDWLLIPIVGIVYALDQLTKLWVESTLCHVRSIPAEGPFQLTCSFNTGSAFGLFPDQTILLILASFVGVGVLLFVYRHHPVPGPLLRISLGLQLGGAVGNLTDRLRFGQVTDFVKLGPWPVFNLADASIVVGVIMLVWLFVFSGDWTKKEPQKTEEGAQTVEAASAAAREEAPPEQEATREQDGD